LVGVTPPLSFPHEMKGCPPKVAIKGSPIEGHLQSQESHKLTEKSILQSPCNNLR
jgi:hypothetical protein